MILPNNKATLNHYELILTENCNLRCKYCFDDTYSDRTSCNHSITMTPSMIDDILSFIKETRDPYKPADITFFGGEPTLNIPFIKAFIEKSEELNFHYGMNTNCTLLTKEIIDFFIENKVSLSISIDGIKESNDKARLDSNGNSVWNKITSTLVYLIPKYRSHNIPICAMMVVNKENYKYLAENYRFLRSLHFDNVNILYCMEDDFNEGQLASIKSQLNYLFNELRLTPYLDLKRRLYNKKYLSQINYCITLDSSVTIAPDGRLFRCHRLVPKMSDDINKEYFGDIYKGYYNKEYLNLINTLDSTIPEHCKDCRAASICKGGCIGCIRNNTGSYGKFEPLCKIEKMLFDLFIKDNPCIQNLS